MQQKAISDFFRPRKRPAEEGAPAPVGVQDARPAESTLRSDKHEDASAPEEKRAHADSTAAPRAESLPFLELCDVFDRVAATTKRLEIAAILRVFFRRLMDEHPADVATVVHLCLSRLGPAYCAPELGLGEALLLRAIATGSGSSLPRLKARLAELGDIGLLAEQTRAGQRTLGGPRRALDVSSVFRALTEIATTSGAAATTHKTGRVCALYGACRGAEARYLFRLLEGKLRIGLAEQSILAGLAQASVLRVGPPPIEPDRQLALDATSMEVDSKAETESKDQVESKAEAELTVNAELKANAESKKKGQSKENVASAEEAESGSEADDPTPGYFAQAVAVIKACYNSAPDYRAIIPPLVAHGIWRLPEHVRLAPGVPLRPMLAFPTRSVGEVLDRFADHPFSCEFKYDGERGQIHGLPDGSVRVYSRNSEDMTQKYPELPARVRAAAISASTFVLDCELVAFDAAAARILPFQVLSTRKRKDVSADGVEVHVCVFAFDLLFLDGRALVSEPFRARRALLHAHFAPAPGLFAFAQYVDPAGVDDIQAALDDAVSAGCEGLMVKTLDAESSYEPSKRSRKWLKVKKDYIDGVADSLDLAVIGAYAGRGKRTGVYGGYLLACYDPDAEAYEAICKIGTGFSEADLERHHAELAPHVLAAPRPYYRVSDAVRPDVWLAPAQVWEVRAADLSLSPTYSAAAGRVPGAGGVSLRFPRFIRVREDKAPEDATTSASVAKLYSKQVLVSEKPAPLDDEDY